MREVKYGGQLQIGDFIAISYASGFTFGWYCGYGKNTLQFFEYNWPVISHDHYIRAKNDEAYSYHKKANSEEFSKNWINKSYVMQWNFRVMKIENPESVFTDQKDLDKYNEAKQILKQIKFI
jgi:hypothetical protein